MTEIAWREAGAWGQRILVGHTALLGAGLGAFVLFHLAGHRRLQPRVPPLATWLREMVLVPTTLTVGVGIGLATVALAYRGFIRFAPGTATAGTVALEFSTYVVLFDAYYYLVHRILHHEPFYRRVHAVHHRSMIPTPLTAFSVHPVEALAAGGFLPLLLTQVSFHLESVMLISAFASTHSLVVHLGHDLVPARWYANPLTGWWLTPAFHDAHHASGGRGNFGGYTTLWDRVLGTIDPAFRAQLGGS